MIFFNAIVFLFSLLTCSILSINNLNFSWSYEPYYKYLLKIFFYIFNTFRTEGGLFSRGLMSRRFVSEGGMFPGDTFPVGMYLDTSNAIFHQIKPQQVKNKNNWPPCAFLTKTAIDFSSGKSHRKKLTRRTQLCKATLRAHKAFCVYIDSLLCMEAVQKCGFARVRTSACARNYGALFKMGFFNRGGFESFTCRFVLVFFWVCFINWMIWVRNTYVNLY